MSINAVSFGNSPSAEKKSHKGEVVAGVAGVTGTGGALLMYSGGAATLAGKIAQANKTAGNFTGRCLHSAKTYLENAPLVGRVFKMPGVQKGLIIVGTTSAIGLAFLKVRNMLKVARETVEENT